ncbi:MAG: V-type H(+)-translocating pyrophosphatase, partial [Phycisphaera sp.]|nr:V-type H(+)-translocating pyrophosphatase [Phycisphaera sp.]
VGGVAVAGLLSGICGFFGMKTATNASARTTAAAKESLNQGLTVAFRAGAVMGLCVTGFALLDISLWFFIFYVVLGDSFAGGLVDITTVTLSFAMGASLQALFARVGGGIYTKAADVGADLVGKVEAGIPEDDARNPATIADNVGDNVGDVAGMGADLYESYYGSVLAAMALAAAAAVQLSLGDADGLRLVTVPPALAGLGILASILSIFVVRTKEGASLAQLLKSLHGGVWASSGLIVLGSAGLLWFALGSPEMAEAGVIWWRLWIAIVVGLLSGLVIAWGTEQYTSYEHAPTQRISEQAQMGPATVIISGIAEGMKSTWIPLITVVVAILVSFVAAGGGDTFLMGVFGVGIAAVGMLSTLGITLATDAYGPIADNAGGNAEMTHQEPYVRERTDMLDSLGNTTAATGKGFAIGSAALTALALLAAYVITVKTNLGVVSATPEQVQASTFVYEGHGIFAMDGNPGGDTPEPIGGLLLTARDRSTILAGFESGGWDVTKATPLGDGSLFEMQDGNKSYFFEIVSTKTATIPQLLRYYNVTLMNPKVLAGLFLGVMLVFVFCAMTMNAVGRAAFAMIDECRRQFVIMKGAFKKNGMSDEEISDPLNWPYRVEVDGKEYPDYASCVDISTAGAQKEMVLPSLMAVAVPIVVGLILGVAGVMGLLAGTLVCGFAVAIFMANAGGAWDNAKKYIETGKFGGKGSDAHKAGVVGDTVGDPFKDTSGPALNILIKLVSVVSVVFAALIVKVGPNISDLLGL